MKVILEFDTTDPEQKSASIRAQKATEAYLVMKDIDDWLRAKVKYNSDTLSEETIELLTQARLTLSRLQESWGINMEDLE
jgi:hypothetical protein